MTARHLFALICLIIECIGLGRLVIVSGKGLPQSWDKPCPYRLAEGAKLTVAGRAYTANDGDVSGCIAPDLSTEQP